MSGINAIIGNLTEILSSSGLTFNQYLQSALTTSSQIISVIISAFLSDIVGCKLLWIISSFGVSICLIIFALDIELHFEGWVSALTVFVYMLFFGIGVGPIPWYISLDFFDLRYCLIPETIVSVLNMLTSFVVVLLYPILNNSIGMFNTILIYAVLTLISALFIMFTMNTKKNFFQTEQLTLI